MGNIYKFCYRCGFRPNHFTICGLLIVFGGIYLFGIGYEYVGFFAIILGLLGDVFDGAFARFTGNVTQLGKILDRFVDKTKFIALVIFGVIFGYSQISENFSLIWAVILFIGLINIYIETWGIILIVYQKFFEPDAGGRAAVWIGKRKFLFQSIFVATLFLPKYAPEPLLLLKPIVLSFSSLISATFAIFSFYYHLKYLKALKFCSLSLPIVAIMIYFYFIFIRAMLGI